MWNHGPPLSSNRISKPDISALVSSTKCDGAQLAHSSRLGCASLEGAPEERNEAFVRRRHARDDGAADRLPARPDALRCPDASYTTVPPPPGPPACCALPSEYDEFWYVTRSIADEVESGCLQNDAPPIQIDLDLFVATARAGSTIRIITGVQYNADRYDGMIATQYAGQLDGSQFTGQSDSKQVSIGPCGDGTTNSTVSGRFSSDGRHFDAVEVTTYRFSSGLVQFTYTWSAEREPLDDDNRGPYDYQARRPSRLAWG